MHLTSNKKLLFILCIYFQTDHKVHATIEALKNFLWWGGGERDYMDN